MIVGEGEVGQVEVLVGMLFWLGLGEEWCVVVDYCCFVIEVYVEWCLGVEFEVWVVEWLGVEVVVLVGFVGVVVEQVDVVVVVWFVGGGGQYCQGCDLFVGFQVDEMLGGLW